MRLVNLTPKEITLFDQNTPLTETLLGKRYVNVYTGDPDELENYILFTFKPYNKFLRILETPSKKSLIKHRNILIPVHEESSIAIENLPPQKPNTIYIASNKICRAAKKLDRLDFIYPNNLITIKTTPNNFKNIGTLSFEKL